MLDANRTIGSGSTARYTLLGVRLDNLPEAAAAERILGSAERGAGGMLINPNVDVLRQAVRDPAVGALLAEADLVLADGAPLVWASRVAGDGRTYRVPGADFIWTLTRAARLRGQRVLLLGGAPGIAAQAADKLCRATPAVAPVASFSPPFGAEQTDEGFAEIIAQIEAAAPNVVFCAFGFPKQERLMARLRPHFPGVWFIGSGASITFVAGVVPRAPKWMQRAGIEWIHRLVTEPRRLFRRYIVHDLPFAARLFTWAALRRAKRLVKFASRRSISSGRDTT